MAPFAHTHPTRRLAAPKPRTVSPRIRRAGLALVGGAALVAATTPAGAQTCNGNKIGTCQIFVAKSVALTTSEGVSVATTDPSEAKTAGQSKSVCDITAVTLVYCGNGVLTAPSHGAAIDDLGNGGQVTYTPDAGFVGTDSFVTQSGLLTDGQSRAWVTTTTYTVTVTRSAEPAPRVSNASITTAYNTPTAINITGSGVITAYAIVGAPAHGAAAVSGSSAIYTPNAGYFGADAFTFDAEGPGGTSNTATLSIMVAPPPAPSATDSSIAVGFDTAATTALPASGVITSYGVITAPAHGAVALSGSMATYTPTAGYYGADSFTYIATGPGGVSNTARISVTVSPPPAPTAGDGTISAPYDTPATAALPGSGVISGYSLAGPPTHGAVVIAGAQVTYTPNPGYIGSDSFAYLATGPGGSSSAAIMSVTVRPPPAPVAISTSMTCAYQASCQTNLASTGIGSTYALASQATLGVCSIAGVRLVYTPAWGAVGGDSCTFTVIGPGGVSQPATVYITITPPPLPDPSGSTGTPIPSSGASAAVCAAGQSASIPGLPGPPSGTAYDPNWCDAQALTIAQKALLLQNQQSQIGSLKAQLAIQQKMLQGLGADPTAGALAAANASAAQILQAATGVGFGAGTTGAAFASAYPAGASVAGFNVDQLNSALQTWQANVAGALQTSIQIQNQIATSQAQMSGAVQGAVNASNQAPGATAAHQATTQILAAISTELTQLEDILLAESSAYTALAAQRLEAPGAAASSLGQSSNGIAKPQLVVPGVNDTRHL